MGRADHWAIVLASCPLCMVLWGDTGSKAYYTTPRSGLAIQEWKVTRDFSHGKASP